MSHRMAPRFLRSLAGRMTLLIGVFMIAGIATPASAQSSSCAITSPTINLGNVSSFTAGTTSQASSGSGGLSCSTVLTLFGTANVKLQVNSSTFVLTGGPANQTMAFAISTTANGTALQAGSSVDLSSTSLVNLFAGSNSSVPLYVRTIPTAGLRAGTYTGTVSLQWYYGLCTGLGAFGVCLGYTSSPGFSATLAGGVSNWGSGVQATVTIQLTIANDCVIDAPNVNFGPAPFVTGFTPITQTININCTAGQAYSVGLNDGANFSSTRRMFSSATSQYLNYEIYQGPSSTTRWGSTGSQRRSSASADVNPGVYDSTTRQGFTYRAVVDPTQTTPSAGSYTDTITLDVSFTG